MTDYLHPDLGLFLASLIVVGIYYTLYRSLKEPNNRFLISFAGIFLFVIASFLNWLEETPLAGIMLAFNDEAGWDFIIPIFFYAPGGLLVCWGFAEWMRLALSLEVEIAEKQKIEENLHKALHQAEEATDIKRTLIGTLSYELRSQLDAMVSFSEILKLQQSDQKNIADGARYIDIIHNSSQALLVITDDLLLLGNLGDPDFHLNEEIVCFQDILLDDNLGLVEKNSEQELTVDVGEKFFLRLDKDLIQKMFYKLLKQARQISNIGDRLHISFSLTVSNELICNLETRTRSCDDRIKKFPPDRYGKPGSGYELVKIMGGTHVLMLLAEYIMKLHGGQLFGVVSDDCSWSICFLFPTDRLRLSGDNSALKQG